MSEYYIAFLRGINVGGNNIIKMDSLREEFTKMGFRSVKTYIQSGNVLFKTNIKSKIEIEKKLETELARSYNYEAKVIVRSKKEMKETIEHFPNIFENADWKHNVIFLSSNIDSKDILNNFEIKKDIEFIEYFPGVIYWSALIDKIGRSTMLKLASRKEYKEMTVRNINTTRKIHSLMSE